MIKLKNIRELVNADVITQETADKIQKFYENKKGQSQNRIFIIFGVLGAMLVGLGIILIIAHNWDEFPRIIKTFLAFIPLIFGQILCGYILIKKRDNIAWNESGTTFLFFAVGASISLISQIYNMPGNLASFLLTWILLCLPLVYVMRSYIGSLLYLAGITYYICEAAYWSYSSYETYIFWILFLVILPHYYFLHKKKPESNFTIFHNWFIPLSVITALGSVANNNEELMFVAYFGLFGLLYLIGNSPLFNQQKIRNNGYLVSGSVGTIILLFMLSFDWFWKDLGNKNFQVEEIITSPEFLTSAFIFLLFMVVFYFKNKDKKLANIKPQEFIFLLFIIIFIIGLYSIFAMVLINILIFTLGIMIIITGTKQSHLGILNYGLLIITVLIIFRFFDMDLSFVAKGIIFILVGVGFFTANYLILKKRNKNE